MTINALLERLQSPYQAGAFEPQRCDQVFHPDRTGPIDADQDSP